MEQKVKRMYYVLSFFSVFPISILFAVYVLFLRAKGMSLLQVGIIGACCNIMCFLSEVPTGSFADLFGRKKSMITGFLVHAAGLTIYYFSANFWLFVLAEVILGIGMAFWSGALEAWIVDSLRRCGSKEKLEDVFKNGRLAQQTGITIGSVVGPYISGLDLELPWLIASCLCLGVGMLYWLLMDEKDFVGKKTKLDFCQIKRTAQAGIAFGLKKKQVFHVMLFFAIMTFAIVALNMYWQPFFFEHMNLNPVWLGWMFFGIKILEIIGNQLSIGYSRLFKKEKTAIVLIVVPIILGLLVVFFTQNIFLAVGGFLFHELGRGATYPLQQAYMNKRIPSETRATILSFSAMLGEVGCVAGSLFCGLVADNFGIMVSWIVSAVILMVCIPVFLPLRDDE